MQAIPFAVMGRAIHGDPMTLKPLTLLDIAPGCSDDLFEGLQRLLAECTHQHPEYRPPAKAIWEQLEQLQNTIDSSYVADETPCDVPVTEEAGTAAWGMTGALGGEAAWVSTLKPAASVEAVPASGQEAASSRVIDDVASLPDNQAPWAPASGKAGDLNLSLSSTCRSPFIAQWATAG